MKQVDCPRLKRKFFNKTIFLFFCKCNYMKQKPYKYIFINHKMKKKMKKREMCSFTSTLQFHSCHQHSVKFVALYFLTHMRLTLNLIVETYKMKSSSCNRKKRKKRNERRKKKARIVKHLNSDFIIEFDLFNVNIYFLFGEICLFINSIRLNNAEKRNLFFSSSRCYFIFIK
jgi:hypothetical protein